MVARNRLCCHPAFAKDRGVTYTVWSPPEPHGIYQANLLALYGVVSATGDEEAEALWIRRLCKALQNTPLTIRDALDLIFGLTGAHILAALAKGYVFGPLQSVPIDEANRFTLFVVQSQAVECDEQLLSQLKAHISLPALNRSCCWRARRTTAVLNVAWRR